MHLQFGPFLLNVLVYPIFNIKLQIRDVYVKLMIIIITYNNETTTLLNELVLHQNIILIDSFTRKISFIIQLFRDRWRLDLEIIQKRVRHCYKSAALAALPRIFFEIFCAIVQFNASSQVCFYDIYVLLFFNNPNRTSKYQSTPRKCASVYNFSNIDFVL